MNLDRDNDRIYFRSITDIDELCANLKKCGQTDSEIAWFRNMYERYKTQTTTI